MVALLKDAINKLLELPEERQAFYAQLLLDELADELHWDERFAESSGLLAQLADEALAETAEGKATKLTPDNLDELL